MKTLPRPVRGRNRGVLVIEAGAPLSPQERRRYSQLTKWLAQRVADDSGEQERSWPVARRAIEENRGGARKRFRD